MAVLISLQWIFLYWLDSILILKWKDHLYRYLDSHDKDNKVSQPCYLYDGNPNTCKTLFSGHWGSEQIASPSEATWWLLVWAALGWDCLKVFKVGSISHEQNSCYIDCLWAATWQLYFQCLIMGTCIPYMDAWYIVHTEGIVERWHLISIGYLWDSGDHFGVKMSYCKYTNSHHKDRIVSWLSYYHNGNHTDLHMENQSLFRNWALI